MVRQGLAINIEPASSFSKLVDVLVQAVFIFSHGRTNFSDVQILASSAANQEPYLQPNVGRNVRFVVEDTVNYVPWKR